ncbi:hypothetical protein Tco_0797628 [Tanacetum coccineum]
MASEALGHDQATVPSEDMEEREEEEVPLRRKRSVYRRARTEFNTSAFAQFHAPLSTDVLPQADISESAGPSVGADKGKAPMPDLEIPAEFLAEDAQARQRLEEEQASARLVQQLQAEDLAQADVPLVSEQRAKELDELLLRMTDTDWLTLMMQVGTNPALARELLGADVNEDNFIERMTAIKERKKRALADLRYRALKGKPLKHSEVTQMMRNLVKNQWCAAHNGTITMKAVKAMSKQPAITKPPSKRKLVERASHSLQKYPAATTQPADDHDSAGGSRFHPAGSAPPLSGSAAPTSAGGVFGVPDSTVPTSAAMDSAGSHRASGVSPFANSADSSSPSPVSTDHIPIDVLFEPTSGVLAEIPLSGSVYYWFVYGVVVVDTLSYDEIVDPLGQVEELPQPNRRRRYFRLNPDVDVGLDLWRDVNLLCQSLHSDDGRFLAQHKMTGFEQLEVMLPIGSQFHPTLLSDVCCCACTARQMVFSSPWLTAKKESGSPLQTALVCNSNPLMVARVDMVINPPWNLPFLGAKGLTSPEQTATGKGISNPLMAVMVCPKPYGIQLTNVSNWTLLIQDFAASFDSAVHRVHAGSFDAAVVSLVSAACVDAATYFVSAVTQSSFVPADYVPADYVSAGHVPVPADRDRIC